MWLRLNVVVVCNCGMEWKWVFGGEKRACYKKKIFQRMKRSIQGSFRGLASGLVFYFYIKPLVVEEVMRLNKIQNVWCNWMVDTSCGDAVIKLNHPVLGIAWAGPDVSLPFSSYSYSSSSSSSSFRPHVNAPVAEGWIGIVVIWFVWMRKNVAIGRSEGEIWLWIMILSYDV